MVQSSGMGLVLTSRISLDPAWAVAGCPGAPVTFAELEDWGVGVTGVHKWVDICPCCLPSL